MVPSPHPLYSSPYFFNTLFNDLLLPSIPPWQVALVQEIKGLAQTPAHHYRQGYISQLAQRQTTQYREPSAELWSPWLYTSVIIWTSGRLILKIRILCVCIFPSGTSERQDTSGMIFKRNCNGCNRQSKKNFNVHDKRSLNWFLLLVVCIPLTLPHSCWIPENTSMQVKHCKKAEWWK